MKIKKYGTVTITDNKEEGVTVSNFEFDNTETPISESTIVDCTMMAIDWAIKTLENAKKTTNIKIG